MTIQNPSNLFFFTCCGGVEKLLENELIRLVGSTEKVAFQIARGGVEIQCSSELGIELAFFSRLAERAYHFLGDFSFSDLEQFKQGMGEIPWSDYFHSNSSFRFSCKGQGPSSDKAFRNSLFLCQLAKDSVIDHFAEGRLPRPQVDLKNADLRFFLYLTPKEDDFSAALFLDLKGKPLTKRGYRVEGGEAPLSEGLAAAIHAWDLEKSPDYQSHTELDPFCGSGTLLCERFLALADVPGQYRLLEKPAHLFDWSMTKFFPINDQKTWNRPLEKLKSHGFSQCSESEIAKFQFIGSDIDEKQLSCFKGNLARIPYAEKCFQLKHEDFFSRKTDDQKITMMANLPFGNRLNPPEGLAELYYQVGETLKNQYKNAKALLYSEGTENFKAIRLRPKAKLKLKNGQLLTEVRSFELY